MPEPISKADLREWKESPVTSSLFGEIRERIREAEVQLGKSAGNDSLQDKLTVGYILALNQVLDFDVEENIEDERS